MTECVLITHVEIKGVITDLSCGSLEDQRFASDILVNAMVIYDVKKKTLQIVGYG